MDATGREKLMQFARFCIAGTLAAGVHYAVYYAMQLLLPGGFWLTVDYTVGYIVSLVCNFFLTTYFTFRSRPSAGKAAGFGFSHVVNYTLHIVLFNLYYTLHIALFNLFMAIGIHRLVSPVLVLMVAVPTNFLILRFVYRKKS